MNEKETTIQVITKWLHAVLAAVIESAGVLLVITLLFLCYALPLVLLIATVCFILSLFM